MSRENAIPLQGRPWADLARRWAVAPFAVLETLLIWRERAEQRAHLRTLDDRMLSDIGLGRADIEREASVPFWRAS